MTEPSPGGAVAVGARSLRTRLTVTVVVITTLLLVVVGIVVDLSLTAALDRDQTNRVADRVARAELLVREGTAPDALVGLLDGRGVRVERRTADGAPIGDGGPAAPDGPGAPDEPGAPEGPIATGRPGPPGASPQRLVTVALPDTTQLEISADPGEIDTVVYRFRGIMLAVGAVGVVVSALALGVGITRGLRPLDTMTGVARAITRGDRGRRLRPARTDTEIGRTAAAFDEMLDALDDTQRRSDESARDAREAAAEARRSEETTRRFLSDAAHELRTPLAGIQALAETLVADADDPELREETAITVVRETARATALVRDMLDLARIEDGPVLRREDVDLGGLVDEEAARLRLLAPDLHVESTGSEAPCVLRGDPDRLRQILTNLGQNARRHTPAGGTIRWSVEGGDDVARVRVADTGDGVPAADRERIFDRLVRLDAARARDADGAGGAGLGLPIARALARAHGGDLRCEPGHGGATFVLELPVTPG